MRALFCLPVWSVVLSCLLLAVLTTLTDRQADRQADSSALTAAAAASVSRDVVADDAVSAAATANVLSWCTIGAQPTHTHNLVWKSVLQTKEYPQQTEGKKGGGGEGENKRRSD